MRIKRQYKSEHYPDLEFNNVVFGESEACVSNGQKRFVLRGKLGLSLVNSAKFGDQIQLQLFSTEFFEQQKANGGSYRRVELFFNRDDIDKLIACLEEVQNGDSNYTN